MNLIDKYTKNTIQVTSSTPRRLGHRHRYAAHLLGGAGIERGSKKVSARPRARDGFPHPCWRRRHVDVIDPERLKRVEAAGPDELFYRRGRGGRGVPGLPPPRWRSAVAAKVYR